MQREKRDAEWYEKQEKWEQEHLGFLQEISDHLDDIRGPLLAQARVYLHEKGYRGGDVVAGKVGKKKKTSIGVQSEERMTGESEKGKEKEKEVEEEQMDEN